MEDGDQLTHIGYATHENEQLLNSARLTGGSGGDQAVVVMQGGTRNLRGLHILVAFTGESQGLGVMSSHQEDAVTYYQRHSRFPELTNASLLFATSGIEEIPVQR